MGPSRGMIAVFLSRPGVILYQTQALSYSFCIHGFKDLLGRLGLVAAQFDDAAECDIDDAAALEVDVILGSGELTPGVSISSVHLYNRWECRVPVVARFSNKPLGPELLNRGRCA